MTDTTFPRYVEVPAVGLSLDARSMGLTPDFLASMAEPLAGAHEEMRALVGGAVANPDEGRRVGHYWLRAPETAPEPALTEDVVAARAAVEAFVAGLEGRFRHVLHIGIGGSALGPQLLIAALAPLEAPRVIHFFDNTDPETYVRVLAQLPLADTLVVVVSKSGGTHETRNGYLAARHAFQNDGHDFTRNAVAITGVGSALDAEAEREGWLARFPMWDWVGGRTSVTSAVGLLPLALAGGDLGALLDGARAMDETFGTAADPATLLALSWYRAAEGHARRAMVVLPYRDRLSLLANYLQQLVMESLGKELDLEGRTVHQGLTVYGNKGSTDQHAYVQQLRAGPDDFFAVLVEVLADDVPLPCIVAPGVTAGDHLSGFLAGTREALREAGRLVATLTLDRLDARSLGAVIALHERAVGLYASFIGVNAYHQPGVEAGKKAAKVVLALQGRLVEALASGASGTATDFAARLDADEGLCFHVLRRLAATGRATATGQGLHRGFAR